MVLVCENGGFGRVPVLDMGVHRGPGAAKRGFRGSWCCIRGCSGVLVLRKLDSEGFPSREWRFRVSPLWVIRVQGGPSAR